MRKIGIVITSLLGGGGLFFLWFYFTGHVAVVGGSFIKEYRYAGNVNELIMRIKEYTDSSSFIKFTLTDTTGNSKNGLAYFIDLELKKKDKDILFTIKCNDERNQNSSAPRTDIKLVFAFDKLHTIGGYNRNATGIKPLINRFDLDFLTPFKNDQHLTITAF